MATEKRLIDANALFPGKILAVNLKNPMETLEYLMSRINNAPTVDAVEVVHGRWIVKEHSAPYGGYHLFHCSECDEPNAKEKNYCPNCGAKMDGERKNNG